MSPSNSDQFCACAETLLEDSAGKPYRVAKPLHHNCDYIRARSELVPQAAVHADDICGTEHRGEGRWALIFSEKMEQLVQPLCAPITAQS